MVGWSSLFTPLSIGIVSRHRRANSLKTLPSWKKNKVLENFPQSQQNHFWFLWQPSSSFERNLSEINVGRNRKSKSVLWNSWLEWCRDESQKKIEITEKIWPEKYPTEKIQKVLVLTISTPSNKDKKVQDQFFVQKPERKENKVRGFSFQWFLFFHFAYCQKRFSQPSTSFWKNLGIPFRWFVFSDFNFQTLWPKTFLVFKSVFIFLEIQLDFGVWIFDTQRITTRHLRL